MSPDVPLHTPATPLDPDPPAVEVVREHPGWFLVLGLAQVLVGVAALALAPFATLLTIMLLGGLALAGAVVEAASVFWSRNWQEALAHVLVALLYAAFGTVMLANPAATAATLTLVLAVLLLVTGAVRFALAVTGRFRGWGWVALGGAVSALLGGLIWADWPENGLWVLGLFVGIDLIVMGWYWVATALVVRGTPQVSS